MRYSVYLIGNPEHNIYKIGVSRNVQKRLRSLKGGLPFPLTTLAAYEIPVDEPSWQRRYALLIESRLHRVFKFEHLQGEWFRSIDLEKFLFYARDFASVFPSEETQ